MLLKAWDPSLIDLPDLNNIFHVHLDTAGSSKLDELFLCWREVQSIDMSNFHKGNLIGRNADVLGFNLLPVFYLSWLGGSESSIRAGATIVWTSSTSVNAEVRILPVFYLSWLEGLERSIRVGVMIVWTSSISVIAKVRTLPVFHLSWLGGRSESSIRVGATIVWTSSISVLAEVRTISGGVV